MVSGSTAVSGDTVMTHQALTRDEAGTLLGQPVDPVERDVPEPVVDRSRDEQRR